ncbi:1-O-acylceramide synthase, putative [Eimeria praecox]|uniref:1-O-acylceramide synthase, putative n=1 Tax=Eimeria praecox TaxID=51316 RepID=U6G817_9EIME|nr:1-O-acylceramide synthase, putative [Eimeria praecox]
MLPGVAGSGLMVTAKNATLPLCSSLPVTFLVPFRLWASLSLVRPPRSHQLCWMDIMQPTADEKGETYASKEGVNIEMDFVRLKSEIETRVEAMGGAKADVLVHSLGSIVFNYFLNKVVDQQWKDKYINSYTLVAPATGGSFKAIKAILTGYNDPVDLTFWTLLDISLIPVDILRDLSRSLGSIYALLPDIDLYGQDHLVVRQLIPKKPGVSTPVEEDSHGPGQTSVAGGGRTLEFRRLAEAAQMGEGGQQTVKPLTQGDRKTEPDGISPRTEQEREKVVQETSNSQAEQRTLQVQSYAAEAQKRIAAMDHMLAAEAEDFEEVIYTLGNWTTLLEPELRVRAETARKHMQGILKDPGVPTRCIWSVFGFPSTDIGYIYTGQDLSRKPIPVRMLCALWILYRVLDVGDDTVPLRSLSVCAGWSSTFEVKAFKNLDHMFIFGDGEFNNYIKVAFGKKEQKK